MMRRLPILLSGLFLAITLARVAEFSSQRMGAGVLGWLFAVGLGTAVYTASYWTRTATTRRQAMTALVFFVGVDAYFNFADVWLSADVTEPLVAAGAVIYGLFPTAATALLGWMSGAITKLPPDAAQRSATNARQRMTSAIAAWVERMTGAGGAGGAESATGVAAVSQPATHETQPPATDALRCKLCGEVVKNRFAFASHMRHKHPRREQ